MTKAKFDDETLKQEWVDERVPIEEMCRRYNISESRMYSILRVRGIRRRDERTSRVAPEAAVDALLVAIVEQRMSVNANINGIAAATSTHRWVIQKIENQLGKSTVSKLLWYLDLLGAQLAVVPKSDDARSKVPATTLPEAGARSPVPLPAWSEEVKLELQAKFLQSGMSKTELGRAVNLTTSPVSRFFADFPHVQASKLFAILAVLGLRLEIVQDRQPTSALRQNS